MADTPNGAVGQRVRPRVTEECAGITERVLDLHQGMLGRTV